jgi:excisionase family DNA binding protein
MVYTVKEAAREMGISEGRVRQLLLEGRIRGKKIGRDWLITKLGYTRKRNYPGKGGGA